jgi:hypothetical protein
LERLSLEVLERLEVLELEPLLELVAHLGNVV